MSYNVIGETNIDSFDICLFLDKVQKRKYVIISNMNIDRQELIIPLATFNRINQHIETELLKEEAK